MWLILSLLNSEANVHNLLIGQLASEVSFDMQWNSGFKSIMVDEKLQNIIMRTIN